MKRNISILHCIALVMGTAASSYAGSISVTIKNEQHDGSFSFTPFWIAAHDGTFDSYDGGTRVSDPGINLGIEELAEDGNTGPITAAFAASGAGLAGGVDATVAATQDPNGLPVFSPQESETFDFNVGDSTVNRYFSYASMLIPSNDLFAANGNPLAHQIFNPDGTFAGPVTIQIFGSSLNDAGTEANTGTGAAFSAIGGAPTDTDDLIRNFFTDQPADSTYLASFVGTGTPGGVILDTFGADKLLATITITPEPGTLTLLILASAVSVRRRRAR